MSGVLLKAFAKINLGLNVIDKLESGYHRVDMVMHAIGLCDGIHIEAFDSEETVIDLDVTGEDSASVPDGSDNLAYKAAYEFLKRVKKRAYVKIILDKKIPTAAGLAGGSTDAAAVLLGLNSLQSEPLAFDELVVLGAEIGADVPFCIHTNALGNDIIFDELKENDKKPLSFCMRAGGIGEVLTPLNSVVARVVLLKPELQISTKEVYEGYDSLENKFVKKADIDGLINALKIGDLEAMSENAENVLQEYTLKKYPKVAELKRKMSEDANAKFVMMSGSGPTIFAIYDKDTKFDLDIKHLELSKIKFFDTWLMKGEN